MEYLDIVDENGQPTGEVVEREVAHAQGIMHRTSHVWIVRKKNDTTQILLQKRCDTKDSFPGCYDISSAGHIPAGVGFEESAVRELKEELGIDAKEDELITCGHRIVEWDEKFFEKEFHDRQYSKVFALWCDKDEEEFKLQAEEVSEVRWMDMDEAIDAVKEDSIPNCIHIDELQMVKNGIKGMAMTKEEFLKKIKEDEEFSPGWQAIDDAFNELYPGQEPSHFATTVQSRAMFGGNEYLDGFSIYNSDKGYKHIVTYGMTILYGDEEAFGGEWNGWGYEMTMKLKEETPEGCMWALDMMSNLARYTYTSERFFEDHHFVGGDGTPIKLGSDSKITALAIVYDTEAKTQHSVYGKTEFLQLVGLTTKEMAAIREDRSNLDVIIGNMRKDGNVDLVTDMNRQKEYI